MPLYIKLLINNYRFYIEIYVILWYYLSGKIIIKGVDILKKRFLSVLLCLVLVFSPLISANASYDQCEYPFIMVRGMDLNALYMDIGTEFERPALKAVNTQDIIKLLLRSGVAGAISADLGKVVSEVTAYAKHIFDNIACDANGNSVYNVDSHKFPGAISNYPDFYFSDGNEIGITKRAVELYGAENVYYFAYDWRMNPLDIADDIEETINLALEQSGKSKVNLVNCSMGGVMTVAYMSKYGYSKLNKCVFSSSTVGGADIVPNLFSGDVQIDPDALYNFLSGLVGEQSEVNALFRLLKTVGAFNAVSNFANDLVADYKDIVYEEMLIETFGNMLSFWTFIPEEKYDECVNFMFGGETEERAEFLSKARQLQEAMSGRDQMIKNAHNDGVGIAFIASYNFPGAPLHKDAKANGDGTIETTHMTLGATVADYGTTFDRDTVDLNSPYLSADLVIDASTCLLADNAWFIKDSPHVSLNYGTQQSDFLFWIINHPEAATVTDNPLYPQFMITDSLLSLSPLS